jgi:hypothetical protein
MKNIIKVIATLAAGALVGAGVYAGVSTFNGGASTPDFDKVGDYTSTAKNVVRFKLAPSNDQLAKCMPKVKVDVAVALETDAKGFDVFDVKMYGAPPNTSFTVFLLEVPASPFGAAEYIGDVNTDKKGTGVAELKLIVEEGFSSTIVGKDRVRKELNHVGMWFADPKDDDFCLGKGAGPVTPFDGDNEAGIQAFNSVPSLPKAPLP